MPEIKTPADAERHAAYKTKSTSIKDKLARAEQHDAWTATVDEDSLPSLPKELAVQEKVDQERLDAYSKKKRNKIVKKPREELIKINVCLYRSQFEHIQTLVETTNRSFTDVIRDIVTRSMPTAKGDANE